MKHLYAIITLLTCLVTLNVSAKSEALSAKDEIDFFARYECQKENIIKGDSTIVNVVLYCNQAFEQAQCTTKHPKAKGGSFKLLPQRGLQQQRVRLEKGVYYAIVVQRYMVASDEIGSIRLPELDFEGTFVIYDSEERYDPFDPFGFFGRPQRKSHTAKGRCKTESFSLPVIAKPKRSTQEVISSGGRVA